MKTLFVALAGLFLAVPAVAQPTFPESWQGLWHFDDITRNCETQQIVSEAAHLDPLCVGDSFGLPTDDPHLEFTCVGIVDDDGANVDCDARDELFGGCDQVTVANYEAILNGDTLDLVVTVYVSFEGDCGPVQDSCFEITSNGVRIGSGESECVVALDGVTWGAVKGLYR